MALEDDSLFDLIYSPHQLDPPFKVGQHWQRLGDSLAHAVDMLCDNILSVILQRPHVGV